MPVHVGRVTWAALSLLVLALPAVAAVADHRPSPERRTGPLLADAPHGWVVAASAVNVRSEHSVDEPVTGLAGCGERVEIVDTWISPVGTRWSRIVVVRSGLSGWALRSLLGRPARPAGPAEPCPTAPPDQ
ncbi:hypothetical protein ACFCX4_29235 [Kitasatospora sp. NPDC056327]|uniref:hypothetical protein n=1 Tax=Kitasatospora sp. NPDC056327 TaxID=3345785 RepID=UPI0035D661D9